MTITQDRMIALIVAGTEFERAYNRACKELYDYYKQLTMHDPSRAKIEALHWNLQNCIKDQEKSSAVLYIEREHFRRNAKRNEYQAKKARKAREAQGLVQRRVGGPSFEQIAETYKRPKDDPVYARRVPKELVDWAEEDLAKQAAQQQQKQVAPAAAPLQTAPRELHTFSREGPMSPQEAAAQAAAEVAREQDEGFKPDQG